MKSLVLLLSTYPAENPRHGGQVRLANVAKTYVQMGLQVEHLVFYEPESYSFSGGIPFLSTSPYRKFRGESVPLINDLLVGVYAVASDGAFSEVLRRLPTKIDVVHVEQPWLWKLALKIKQIPAYKNVCLVYGSQNIEAPLKEEILKSYGVHVTDEIVAEIDALERQATRDADISVAVTRSDLDILVNWGARNPVLAPNGIAAWRASPDVIARWKERLPEAPWILYVASAHPPNFTGFVDCIGGSLGCIPPTSRLVVAGSVSNHIYQELATTHWSSLNISRLQLLFSLPDEDLAAVKTLAHAFLLPIPHGGGSNIKTAEALYSGAYVVGTEAAFRGFKDFVDLPEVEIVRTPAQLQKAVRDVLTKPSAIAAQRETRDVLLWDHCLKPLSIAVSSVLRKKGWKYE